MPVRRARKDEAETLAFLGAETFRSTFGHIYDAENLARFLTERHSTGAYEKLLASPNHALWFAETDMGEPVGYALAGPCGLPVPDRPDSAGEVQRIYLLANARGLGLGKALLDAAVEWLRARYEHVYLSVYAQNPRAQKFYADAGFVKIHDYHFMVGEHADPEWIMELRR